jgi:NAD+ diphosphatase
MTRPFLAADFVAEEVSARTGFAGNRLDRLAEARDESTMPAALAHGEARGYGIARGRLVVDFSESPRGLIPLPELQQLQPKADRAVLLGFDGDAPRLAVPVAADPDNLPAPYKAVDFRSLAIQGLLPADELGQVAQAGSLLNWHSSARFCGRCGSPTELRDAGAKRHCPSCERDQFPRTDPVVIMLIVSPDGEQCLLGRSPHFPPGMVSALAGFVEAGETLEMAVRRETFEEAGIRIGDVSYHASQPWPFPHTLMIGCMGRAMETGIVRDEAELEACDWYSREQVLEVFAQSNAPGEGELSLPFPMAIAHTLIRDWAEGRASL